MHVRRHHISCTTRQAVVLSSRRRLEPQEQRQGCGILRPDSRGSSDIGWVERIRSAAIGVRPSDVSAETTKDVAGSLIAADWRVLRRVQALWSGRDGLHFAGQLAQNEPIELNLLAGLVDVDTDEPTGSVVVQDNPLGDLPTFDTGFLAQIDIQRIRIGKVDRARRAGSCHLSICDIGSSMIHSYHCPDTRRLFETGRSKRFKAIERVATRKLARSMLPPRSSS